VAWRGHAAWPAEQGGEKELTGGPRPQCWVTVLADRRPQLAQCGAAAPADRQLRRHSTGLNKF
jgi:hypothetical protein